MTRERCRTHGLIFAVSLVGIPFCPICRRDERAAIDRLVQTGKVLADKAHVHLLEEAESIDTPREAL